MATFDEKVERLKTLKECLKGQDVGMPLEPLLTTSDLERLLKVDRRTITRLPLLGPGSRHAASNLGRGNPALERTRMQATLRQEVQFWNLKDEHHFAIRLEQLLQVTTQ